MGLALHRITEYRFIAVLTLAVTTAGCATLGGRAAEAERAEAAGIHAAAMEALDSGDFDTALEGLKTLHHDYSATPHGERATLAMAYTASLAGRYDRAIEWAEAYAEDGSGADEDLEYALYLRAAAAHAQWNERNSASPDTAAARRAFGYYRDLVVRFPEGERTEAALRKMNELRGDLASVELRKARQSLEEGEYPEAAERAAWVAEQYRGGRHAADALVVQIEALERMGRARDADATRRMLEILFPDHPAVRR